MRFGIRIITAVAVSLAGAAGAALGNNAQAEMGVFIGVWEGTDAVDGSRSLRAIAAEGKGGGDRVLIVGKSDYFSFCEASDGDGMYYASGSVLGTTLTADTARIECADGTTVERDGGHFHHDATHDILYYSVEDEGVRLVLHRLSRNPDDLKAR